MRALRLEPVYVLLTGLVAALGWLCMLGLAMGLDPTGAVITRDFVTYLTSSRILIGAETDKIISILVLTAVLAIALIRAKRILVREIAVETAVEDLSAFFEPDIADKIAQHSKGLEAGAVVRRDVAVLVTDLRGFSRFAARSRLAEVIELLNDYHRVVVETVHAHGGAVDKFLGDGLLASFGTGMEKTATEKQALHCAESLMAALDDWSARRRKTRRPVLAGCIAVTHGPVLHGVIGAGGRLELTLIGECVNLAVKLDKFSKRLGCSVITTLETLKRAETRGYRPLRSAMVHEDAHVNGLEGTISLACWSD